MALDGRLLGKAADEDGGSRAARAACGAHPRGAQRRGRDRTRKPGGASSARRSAKRRSPSASSIPRRSTSISPLGSGATAPALYAIQGLGSILIKLHPRRLLERRRAAGADAVRVGAVAALSAGARDAPRRIPSHQRRQEGHMRKRLAITVATTLVAVIAIPAVAGGATADPPEKDDRRSDREPERRGSERDREARASGEPGQGADLLPPSERWPEHGHRRVHPQGGRGLRSPGRSSPRSSPRPST